MAKKIKKELTQEERLDAYYKATGFKKLVAKSKLTKEDKALLKKQKQDRAKELETNKTDFNFNKNSYEVVNWNLWYGPKHALYNINLEIEKNKVTALIGTNGSGKTTFLRSLNRMNGVINHTVHTTGNIYFFNGTNLYSPIIPQVELTTRVGFISQRPTPFHMSIYDNVAYGPRNHGITNKKVLDEIVKTALDEAALWDEVKDKLADFGDSLSGGQQQRLCIARAIALKPEVLLMDQPTGGLDPIATTFVENLILKLKRKFTIVMVTHSMTQAQRVSDKVVFFDKGRIVEEGPTKQVFTNPKNKETIDFILGR